MSGLRKIYYCSIVFLFAVHGLYAQTGQQFTATGQITAEVIPVFTVSETSQLSFGKFSPGHQGGELILTPRGSISVLGTVWQGGGLHNPACFFITGSEDAAFSVSLPAVPVIITHESGSRTMEVRDWKSVPAEGAGTGMLQNGFKEVFVGATLKVGTLIDNPAGRYRGSYNITFDFN
ncbi:MAG: DUF4402 domain-containing protein [Bacteroidales bacterium]|jgi:hypothetical protein|nr:DUF4402 domain-containing protein [Bacteroidales bacterium]